MQALLDAQIPAVVLIPLLLGCLALWRCSQWIVHSNEVRSAEVSRLSRIAREEQARLERDREQGYGSHEEYPRQRQGAQAAQERQIDDSRVEYRSQPVSGYDYPRRVQVQDSGYVDSYDYPRRVPVEQDSRYADSYDYSRRVQAEQDSRYTDSYDYRRREDGEAMRRRGWDERRSETEAEEVRIKQAKELAWRKQAEVEELRRKLAQAEEEERRHREAAEAEIRARLAVEAEKMRIAGEEEVRRRRAEEESRRIAEEEEGRQKRAEEEIRKIHAEDEERKRRQAALDESNMKAEAEAQAKKVAEEAEIRRKKLDEIIQKGTQDDFGRIIDRKVPPPSKSTCVVCQKPTRRRCARCKTVFYCSRECQVQHWHDGHKSECRTLQACSSPSSSEGGARRIADLLSPRSSRSDVGSDEIVAPSLSPSISPAPTHNPPAISHSAPVSPLSGSLLKTSSTVSADGRRLKPKKVSSFDAIEILVSVGKSYDVDFPNRESLSLYSVLFSYDDFVELFDWDIKFPPCGLFNCGNSCFANAVLQCLTYTQPLVAYLLRGDHGGYCKNRGWCFMCTLEQHAFKVKQNRSPFPPLDIVSQLRNIGTGLSYGKQEDAHEFMSYAIHLMQSICLTRVGGEKAVDDSTQETTLIHHIFGGLLQSQVRCMECGHQSNIYENMMDLAVEIQGNVESLEDALREFTTPEILDGENKYKCDRCNAYVEARKQITIHESPNILIVTLKRFKAGRFGKLNKRVAFSEVLDMTSYMSQDGDRPPRYTLYAVVVHVDVDDSNATYYGHYICLVKNPNGCWYRVDDSQVTQVDIYTVTSQQAYMLLYKRSNCRPVDSTQNVNHHLHQQASSVAQDWYVASSFTDHSQPPQFPLHMYPYSTRTDRTDSIHVPIGISSGYG